MKELLTLLQHAQRVSVIAHVHPDGDAVGSILALTMGLEQLGKQVTPFLSDGVPPAFRFVKGSERVLQNNLTENNPEAIVIIDTPDLARTGFTPELKRLLKTIPLLYIDHHPEGDLLRQSTAQMHDQSASAATELVYTILKELEVKLIPDIATALLTGIYTDTSGFQNAGTTNRVLEVAAELMQRGGKLNLIVQQISNSKTMASLKLLGLALERLRLTQHGQIAVSVITHTDIATARATANDLSGIIGNLNTLPQVKVAVLLTEVEPGIIRGMLRTGKTFKIDITPLARLLGGGGHPMAAGFSLTGKIILDKEGVWRLTS